MIVVDANVIAYLVIPGQRTADDELPKHEQETVIRLVDAVLAKHQLEHLADRVKRSA